MTLVGQWTNESRTKQDTVRDFTQPTDKIGAPIVNQGSLRGLGKVFLGWSDQPPVNGKVAPGVCFFSSEDLISTAFPNGIPADARLYGIYFSLIEPDSPLPDSNFGLFQALTGGLRRFAPGSVSIRVNGNTSVEDFLPNSPLHSTTRDDSTGDVTVVDTYVKKDDRTSVNEVVLGSEFSMDNSTAMVVYKNPAASNQWLPVLSRNYSELLSGNNELPTAANDRSYTYVDLNIELGEGISVPETLSLEFESYLWRPLYVLNAARERLNIVDPNTGADLGNTKASFSSLVSNASPKTRFDVKTGGSHTLTIRTILRHGDAEKIREANVVAAPGKSKGETIVSNMKLRAVPLAEHAAAGSPDPASRTLTISDEKAAELAETQGTQLINVQGTVTGNVVPHAGFLNLPILGQTALSTSISMGTSRSNTVSLGYWRPAMHNVTYSYESVSEGRALPDGIVAPPAGMARAGEELTLPAPGSVPVEGGSWEFKGWYKGAIAEGNEVSGASITMGDEDLALVGAWEFRPAVHRVTFSYVSGTPGKDLPGNLTAPAEVEAEHGTPATVPTPSDHKVDGGTWVFKGWYRDSVAPGNEFTESSIALTEDISLVGLWEFVADPVKPGPADPGTDTGKKPGKKTPAVKKSSAKLPATGDAMIVAAAAAATGAAAGLGSLALRRRARNEKR